MSGCAAPTGSTNGRPAVIVTPNSGGVSALNLLMVSDNECWTRAVRAAVEDLGAGSQVAICGARHAVTRLAGLPRLYSHLLVEPGCADGLLGALVDLTTNAGESNIRTFLLGTPATVPPRRVGVIPSASRQSVREALVAQTPSAGYEKPTMQLSELRAALAGEMIETRYQPIVRLLDRVPTGLEALARLNHPDRGTVMPDLFVPQLEDAGLAPQLTDAVASCAFADLAGPALLPLALDVSLNFPLDVLLVPEALDRLEAQRQAKGILVGRVVIELTESKPVQDAVALGKALERLRAAGYRIVIDDVGPAVPQLAGLIDLPFTGLKLDKELVHQIELSADAKEFAARTIDAAHRRGLTVVAEGVEDVATWHLVKAMAVEQAQGFLLARALPVAAVPVWIEEWRNQPDFE